MEEEQIRETRKNDTGEKNGSPVKGFRFGITEGLIIGAAPFFAYALCFLYEAGYCGYFRVPVSLIDVGLSNVMKVLAFLLILIYMVIFGVIFFLNLFRKKQGVLGIRLIALCVFSLIFVGIPLLVYGFGLEYIVPAGVALIISSVYLFLEPILFCRDVKGYRNKLDKAFERRSLINPLPHLFPSIPKPLIPVIIILILALFYSYIGGRGFAKRQNYFLVNNSEPNTLVLRIYKNKAICAKIDREKRLVLNEYSVINTENNVMNLKWEKVGNLKPEFTYKGLTPYIFETGCFDPSPED